jgi:hypothetical protein
MQLVSGKFNAWGSKQKPPAGTGRWSGWPE